MANTQSAFINQYTTEYIQAFEQDYTLLRMATYQHHQINGNVAVFLVAGSGGLSAVTRGINGLIPFGIINNSQLSCTLAEKHGPFETTDFNIFASQGDQKRIMQAQSINVLSRDIDQTIIDELDSGVVTTTGTSVTASTDLVEKTIAILGNNSVPVDEEDKMFAVISPAFRAYLRQTTEYNNGFYVDVKPLVGPIKKMWRWSGVNWITNIRLTGIGTSTEKCYMFHQNAIGHAADTKTMKVDVGYERKQQNSWTNATLFHGAKTLQTAGIGRAHV